MTRKGNMIRRLLFAAVLLLGSAWSCYLAAFNWWAAGGPPTAHPERYELRGNIFFAVGCVLFLVVLIPLLAKIVATRREKS